MDGVGQGGEQLSGGARRQRAAAQVLRERATGDVFQGEERPAAMFADFVNLHDVRVAQPGHRLGFPNQAGAKAR